MKCDIVKLLLLSFFYIGDRNSDSTETLIKTIKAMIHGVQGLITTDGLEAYVEKIKVYFKWSRYAQVVKEWKGGRISMPNHSSFDWRACLKLLYHKKTPKIPII